MFLLFATTAWGLNVPNGWTSLGDSLATLDPQHPELGELRELVIPSGSGDTQDLIAHLDANGLRAKLKSQEPGGDINLVIAPDKLARARASITQESTTWYLVIAEEHAAEQLDANALLTIMQGQIPLQLSWGSSIEVLPAGNDGSLWDMPTEQERVDEGWTGWQQQETLRHDSHLYGLWNGQATYLGKRQDIRLTLEATGRARLARESEGRTCIWEGTWGVKDDRLLITPFAGDPVDSAYQIRGLNKLEFVLEGQTVTLNRVK